MVVHVEQIEEEGLTLDRPVGAELLTGALAAESKDTGFRASEGSRLSARFQKVSEGILLTAELTAKLIGACGRCLEEVPVELPVTFTLSLVPESEVAEEEPTGMEDDERSDRAGSFSLEDADEEVFDGRTIDLAPILQEQLLLALPMHVLCKDDCLGLCPVCGQNLNEAQCGCDTRIPDPRWDALKQIKIH